MTPAQLIEKLSKQAEEITAAIDKRQASLGASIASAERELFSRLLEEITSELTFKNREMIADFAPIPMGDINEANKFLSAEISRLMQENSSLKMKIERVHKWAGDHSAKMSIAIDAARNLAGCPISAKTFSDRKSVCDEVIEIINI